MSPYNVTMAQDSTLTAKISIALVIMVTSNQSLPAEKAQSEVWYSAAGDVVKIVEAGSVAAARHTSNGAGTAESEGRLDKVSYETEALFALHGGGKRTTRNKALSSSGYRSSYSRYSNHRRYSSWYNPSYFGSYGSSGYQRHYSFGSRRNSQQSFYQPSSGKAYSRNTFSANRISYQKKGWSVRLNF